MKKKRKKIKTRPKTTKRARPKRRKPEKPQKRITAGRKAEKLLRLSAVLIEKGRKRGFITYDEILKEFPTVENDVIFLEGLYEKLSGSGIDVLEGGGLLDESASNKTLDYVKEDGTYDSIQMYLKEIGQHQLITGAMEKELAKTIALGYL